jgi:hypothetical protein
LVTRNIALRRDDARQNVAFPHEQMALGSEVATLHVMTKGDSPDTLTKRGYSAQSEWGD